MAITSCLAAETPANPERVPLWPVQAPVGDGTFDTGNAFITVHPAAKPNGAAFVICPGGGYGGLVTGGEGHGIARWLNGHGITGIVLEYRLPKGRSQVPLLDARSVGEAIAWAGNKFVKRVVGIERKRGVAFRENSAAGHVFRVKTHGDNPL